MNLTSAALSLVTSVSSTNNLIILRDVSDECRQIFEIVNYMTLIGAVSLFGIVTNIINIVAFYKQGLVNTTNISLFGIAISDLASLVTLVWLAVCINPYAAHADLPFIPEEVQYLTGSWPHLCFTRVTCWITVYITAERCICIVHPLKVKQIITPRRTKTVIITIFNFMMLSLVPEYTTVYFGWKPVPPWNTSRVGLVFTSFRQNVVGFSFILHSILGMTSFLMVIVLTVTLVLKLKQKATWRTKATFRNDQSEAISDRDKKTMKMVVLISLILIICFIPSAAMYTAIFVEPEFTILGGYRNIFYICSSFVFLFEAINSSVNIFLYYNMSTKYKQTVDELIFRKKPL